MFLSVYFCTVYCVKYELRLITSLSQVWYRLSVVTWSGASGDERWLHSVDVTALWHHDLPHVTTVTTSQPAAAARRHTGEIIAQVIHVHTHIRSMALARDHPAWHSGRTSVSGRRTFPVLRLTCSWWVTTIVGRPSAIGQPTRPTQPFILSGSIKWVVSWNQMCAAVYT